MLDRKGGTVGVRRKSEERQEIRARTRNWTRKEKGHKREAMGEEMRVGKGKNSEKGRTKVNNDGRNGRRKEVEQ